MSEITRLLPQPRTVWRTRVAWDWADYLRKAYNVERWASCCCSRPLRAGTGCSGTDAPIEALRTLIPETSFEHVFCAGTKASSIKLIMQNFAPCHCFSE
eukprot:9625658-Alexandrium_andersonii.AAC.1